ncbi:hypothetical protein ACFLS4_04910, partial [Bacteroidota bacterium]
MLISIVLSIITSIIFSVSQPEFTLEKELNYKANYFTIDQLGYLYIVSNSELRKVDIKSNQEKNYSNSLLGKIHSVDVSDPFRTLLFYKDFNKIEFLDKNLSQITSAINLDDLGYYNVSAICQSVNGGFWIFDQSLDQLVYIDKNLKTVKKSVQLTDMIDQNADQEQVFMLEKNDYIYMGISGEGILLFDNYGTYIKTFPLLNIEVFQVNNGTISYY